MWVVYRCIRSYEDVFCIEYARYSTETEADAIASELEINMPFVEEWSKVEYED